MINIIVENMQFCYWFNFYFFNYLFYFTKLTQLAFRYHFVDLYDFTQILSFSFNFL